MPLPSIWRVLHLVISPTGGMLNLKNDREILQMLCLAVYNVPTEPRLIDPWPFIAVY